MAVSREREVKEGLLNPAIRPGPCTLHWVTVLTPPGEALTCQPPAVWASVPWGRNHSLLLSSAACVLWLSFLVFFLFMFVGLFFIH